MITMTEKAAAKAREIAEKDRYALTLRMRVIGGGCAGFQYDMYFDELEPTDMDEVIDCHGVRLVVDPLSFQYLDGTQIDYLEEEFESGFKFLNPNVDKTCGCGSSFSA
jgi:iron-sulfur cluster insertion protein